MRNLFVLSVLLVLLTGRCESRSAKSLKQLQNVLADAEHILEEIKDKVSPPNYVEDTTTCEDESANCERWKTEKIEKGDDWLSDWCTRKFFKEHCEMTCELCDGESESVDETGTTGGESGGAGGAGGAGGSEGSEEISTSTCEDKSANCETWKTDKGDAWLSKTCAKDFYKKHCEMTCELCETGTTDGGESGGAGGAGGAGGEGGSEGSEESSTSTCEDKSANCETWKTDKGDDWLSKTCAKEFYKKNCQMTCELCDGESGTTGGGESGGAGGAGGAGGEGGSEGSESGGAGGSTGGSTGGAGGSTSGAGEIDGTVTTPAECTDENKGHCECGDPTNGITTYVFQINGVTRCFTVYHPSMPSETPDKYPVVLSSQCYGKDRLSSIGMAGATSKDNKAAKRFEYARIGLSSPDGFWTFGNDGIVNDDKPMPCSGEDSKDMAYVKAVFDFIDANTDMFDGSKVWAEGFSQNSMFSAFIGFCFSNRVLGIWQGGSGMAINEDGHNLPGCQSLCSASIFAEYNKSCNQCVENAPCTECTYWPIYPCFNSQKPMVNCLADYDNDYIASSRADASISTSQNMYDKMVAEGHDARRLRFNHTDDTGGHQNPKNTVYWQVGCLGITAPCTSTCEESFMKCIKDETVVSNVDKFANCMDKDKFASLGGCTASCAPTLPMLENSEKPEVLLSRGKFGAGDSNPASRPETSKCTA